VPSGWGLGRGCPLPTGGVFDFYIARIDQFSSQNAQETFGGRTRRGSLQQRPISPGWCGRGDVPCPVTISAPSAPRSIPRLARMAPYATIFLLATALATEIVMFVRTIRFSVPFICKTLETVGNKIKVPTNKCTQVHGAQCFLVVTHPNRGRRNETRVMCLRPTPRLRPTITHYSLHYSIPGQHNAFNIFFVGFHLLPTSVARHADTPTANSLQFP